MYHQPGTGLHLSPTFDWGHRIETVVAVNSRRPDRLPLKRCYDGIYGASGSEVPSPALTEEPFYGSSIRHGLVGRKVESGDSRRRHYSVCMYLESFV